MRFGGGCGTTSFARRLLFHRAGRLTAHGPDHWRSQKPIRVGAQNHTLYGYLDGVCFYDLALTDQEIADTGSGGNTSGITRSRRAPAIRKRSSSGRPKLGPRRKLQLIGDPGPADGTVDVTGLTRKGAVCDHRHDSASGLWRHAMNWARVFLLLAAILFALDACRELLRLNARINLQSAGLLCLTAASI